MRIIIFLLSVFLLAQPILSQTKKEMQEQMLQTVTDLKKQIADMEKDIATAKDNKEDADTIKEMQNELAQLKQQLALIQSVNKGISGMSDKTIQQASEDEGEAGLPKKDIARINALPKKILSDAELVLFVKKVQAEVDKTISVADKTNAQQLLNELKTDSKTPVVTANVAAECWMVGASSMGLYLMGKACVEDMSNTDNLNNYAAFLTMKGGEHAAIPILGNLHNKFPGNSTILNNLGQAWFGLGEMNNANKYLDSTMHFYANHSQANETKSEIQESKGQAEEAIASLKRSIEEAYTPEKEARLEKLGGKLNCETGTFSEHDKVISWKYPGPAQPLGIEKFIQKIPDYPMSVEDAEARKQDWTEFRDNITVALDKLDAEIIELKKKADANKKELLDPSRQAELMSPYNNIIFGTANRKLLCLGEWATDQIVRLGKKFEIAGDTIQEWKNKYDKVVEMVSTAKPTTDEEQKRLCRLIRDAGVEYISNSNLLLQQLNTESLTFYKEYISAKVRLFLYAFPGRPIYEWEMAEVKAKFLSMLRGVQYIYIAIGECPAASGESQRTPKELPDFDEVNCQYKTELNMYFTKIKVECNKMTTTIEVSKFKSSLEENLATGKYNGKAEIEVGIGSDEIKLGPLKAEAEIKGRGGVEFNQDGIQDVYIEGETEISAGPVKVSGATARYGFISGKGSITGSGALSGISIR